MRRPHRVGPASMVFYDVSTLYFQTDTADGLRQPRVRQGTAHGTPGHDRTPTGCRGLRGQLAETATMLPFSSAAAQRRGRIGSGPTTGKGEAPAFPADIGA